MIHLSVSVSSLHSSLDTRSKQRLDDFIARLETDRDDRHFDYSMLSTIRRYLKNSYWRDEFELTTKYLDHLRSTEDGHLYSQGVKEYKKLRKSAEAFGEPNYTYFGWCENFKRAKEEMIKQFRKMSLHPLQYHSDDDIANALPRKDTHAGFEYIRSGKKEKGDNLEHVFSRYSLREQQARLDGSFNEPILPGVRTQGNGHAFNEDGSRTGDCSHKTRIVMMVSMWQIIAELKFAKPLQNSLGLCSWYAGGKSWDPDLSIRIRTMASKNVHWVTLDYSGYDHSISAWLIHAAFDIMREAFLLNDSERELFAIVEHDFIEKDIIIGHDKVVHSVRGVPSGSMFTQIVDSIVNRLMLLTYFHSAGIRGDMLIMGDDNFIVSQSLLDIGIISSYISKNFGITVNASKSSTGVCGKDPPSFLSARWTGAGRWREPHELIGRLLYPERNRHYLKDNDTLLVLYCYYLAYPRGIKEFIDIYKLFRDQPRLQTLGLRTVGSQYLPGALQYLARYDRSWSVRA